MITDIEKTEILIEGYLQALIGHEFTKHNKDILTSHIDRMLHQANLDLINSMEEDTTES